MSILHLDQQDNINLLLCEPFSGSSSHDDNLLETLKASPDLLQSQLCRPYYKRSPLAALTAPYAGRVCDCGIQQADDDAEDDEVTEDQLQAYVELKVDGADIGDIPAEYVVQGILPQEFPVIGTYVSRAITPGFMYQVRLLSADPHAPHLYLFGGRGVALRGVGMGYAKRITFQGDSRNYNNNYFYSDSHLAGYGFNPAAIEEEQVFTIHDSNGFTIGHGTVLAIHLQKEISCEVVEDTGDIEKHIFVAFECSVEYGTSPCRGLVPLHTNETLHVSGTARLYRKRGSACARLDEITGVDLPDMPTCTFRN